MLPWERDYERYSCNHDPIRESDLMAMAAMLGVSLLFRYEKTVNYTVFRRVAEVEPKRWTLIKGFMDTHENLPGFYDRVEETIMIAAKQKAEAQ